MFSTIMRKAKLLLVICISVVLLDFAAVNRDFIEISLFPLSYALEIPKFLLAIVCFGAGLLVGGLVMSLKVSRMIRLAKKEHKHVMALQNEIAGAKAEQSVIANSAGDEAIRS